MICDDPSQLAVTGQSMVMVMVMVVCAIALVAVGAVVVVGARRRAGVALLLVAALAIVGLGSGVTPASAATDACGSSTSQDYTVGGSVSGLTGTVALTLNGSDNLTVPSNGPFTFSTPVASGATYTVTVATQPATQTCTVTNGTGTVAATNITNVQVACIDNSYTVGGSVSGLTGTVALTLNGSDNLTVPSNGPFTFSTPVASGATYTVTVATQPATQTCTVTNGTGTVAATNITNVQVACIDN